MSGTISTPVSDANGKLQSIRTVANDLNARFAQIRKRGEALGSHIKWQKQADAYFGSLQEPSKDPGFPDYEANRKTPEQHLDMLKQLMTDIDFCYTVSIKLTNELSDHAKLMNSLAQDELKQVLRPGAPPMKVGGISQDATKASPEQAAENEQRTENATRLQPVYQAAPKL